MAFPMWSRPDHLQIASSGPVTRAASVEIPWQNKETQFKYREFRKSYWVVRFRYMLSEKWTKVFANSVHPYPYYMGLSLSHVTDCTNKQTNKQTNRKANNKPTGYKKGYSVCLCSSFCWLVGWVVWKGNSLWPTDKTDMSMIHSTHPPCSIKSPLLYDGHLISLHYNPPLHHLETTGGKFCQTREPLRLTHHKLVWTMMKKVNACIYLDLVYTGWLLLSNQTLNLNTTQSMNGGDNEWCSRLLG